MKRFSILTIALALIACDDGGPVSDDAPRFSSGVAADRQIDELKPEEVEALCAAAEEAFEPVFGPERLCTAVAVRLAQSPEGCGQVRDDCLAQHTPRADAESCEGPPADLDVDVTIGEYEACFNAVLDKAAALAEGSCASPTGEDAGRPLPEVFFEVSVGIATAFAEGFDTEAACAPLLSLR